MEYEIKRIPLAPVVKVAFFVFLVLGFLGGLLYGMMLVKFVAVLSATTGMDSSIFQEFSSFGIIGVVAMGIFTSIFTSVIATGFTIIGIATYNAVAKIFGGIKLQLHSEELEKELYYEEDEQE
jgi:hypothetical protein